MHMRIHVHAICMPNAVDHHVHALVRSLLASLPRQAGLSEHNGTAVRLHA